MTWDRQELEADTDYGFQPLPYQEEPEEKDIIFNIDKEALTDEEQEELEDFLRQNVDLFAKHDGDLGDTDLMTHTIDVGDAEPVKARPYRLNPEAKEALEKHVDTMLKHNIIEESIGSPWPSPVVLVKKPNSSEYRFCLDMRKVNRVTKIDSYPLLRIDDTLDALNGAKYFTSLDLKSAFHQVRMDEKSKHLTTFVTHIGSNSFLRMPYGIVNATATSQQLMEKVLKHLTWHICLVYVDDVIIYSKDYRSHLDNLDQVFMRIREANLKMHPEKCKFMHRQIEYLGCKISQQGTEPSDDKAEVVRKFESPKNTKESKQFWGFQDDVLALQMYEFELSLA